MILMGCLACVLEPASPERKHGLKVFGAPQERRWAQHPRAEVAEQQWASAGVIRKCPQSDGFSRAE